ncbi:nucleotidyl transferase AbiEii/AbiGii toxin family protein [Candidatus Peregrinibacteria bacterium]|nr:nucleotidyl transferase AbiEii/AbiGii toxin family protein [Candidatus Peregrinibacteria bacterium]
MSEQISKILKRKLEDTAYGGVDAETRRNTLKEELQFHILNFIYNHPEYSKWIMYGGSSLRIIHGLDRMSVDLDFEIHHAVTVKFLKRFKKEMENHFTNTYGAGADFLTIKITTGRGLLLKFHLGEELRFGHSSKQVHVKIDLNHFIAPNTVTERRPINHDQLSFVVTTYNMGSLMASKIAAIFLRGTRGVGKAIYEEKGRDIYDLLWYMGKKAVPDFDYLMAKNIDTKDIHALFDKLTLRMNKVNDENLKQDLLPLFMNRTYIENWLGNWRESYLRLLYDYKITTTTILESIAVNKAFDSDNFSFIYWYGTKEGGSIKVACIIGKFWIKFQAGDLPTKINDQIIKLVDSNTGEGLSDRIKQYTTLFYEKTEAYFKKNNRTMLGDSITTKVIRMTAEKFNRKEDILLNKSTLLSCELDDLLK